VAVTFDDGYACNMDTAVPTLEELQVPATFLVTAGSVGDQRESLADELWRILRHNSEVARVELRLRVDGTEHRWRPAHTTADYHEVFRLLRSLPGGRAASHLESLRDQAAVPAGARSSHRPLTREDVHALSRSGLFEVGSHTLTHPSLAREDEATQMRELVESKRLLEGMTGRSVRSFAYPYGGVEDVTFRTAACVERAGYACALTTFPAAASSSSDPYRLPRLHVKDWDAPALARRLARLTIR
jgi:peptidoglycan/xylan/chitin deacetylase (PgdA/CDA1 family)